jgi:hypothetical protein
MNGGIINSITRLHLVGYLCWDIGNCLLHVRYNNGYLNAPHFYVLGRLPALLCYWERHGAIEGRTKFRAIKFFLNDLVTTDEWCRYEYRYICWLQLGSHPVAVVQYTYTHEQYRERHKTNNIGTTQKLWRVRAVPRLCRFYPGISLQLRKSFTLEFPYSGGNVLPWHLPYNWGKT